MGVGIKELYAEKTEYGMRKGIMYSKELGAEADRASEHSTVIFPFMTQTGKAGEPRSDYQVRVPIDDTHTYHVSYQVYAAPSEIAAAHQEVIPWYEPPTVDERGRPILDYILAQDAAVWVAQGDIVDRSQEILGRTDVPISLLRKQLDEQIRLVEEGKAPMNVFAESPPIIHSSKPANLDLPQAGSFRRLYHRGFGMDDVDRYGPAFELVKDLHRRIEEAALTKT
jgi:5,5'-dehydrodivanillate O-demethylase